MGNVAMGGVQVFDVKLFEFLRGFAVCGIWIQRARVLEALKIGTMSSNFMV